jgi:hypothetical protein
MPTGTFANQQTGLTPLMGPGRAPVAIDHGARTFRSAAGPDEAQAKALVAT